MAIVLINISRWVKGCADLPSNDDRLWRWVSADPVEILERTARLARVAITGLSLRPEGDFTDICARTEGQPKPVPMVTICGGLSLTQLEAALKTSSPKHRSQKRKPHDAPV